MKTKITLLHFCAFFFFQNAFAQSGELDISFGDAGITTWAGYAGSGQIFVNPDNSILNFSNIGYEYPEPIEHKSMLYHADGSINTGYGTDGFQNYSTPFGLIDYSDQYYGSLVIACPDNKFYLAGIYSYDIADYSTIQRNFSNGSVDTSFGDNGAVIVEPFPYANYSELHFISLQDSDKVIAVGVGWGYIDHHWFAGRYKASGAIDSAFGVNGYVSVEEEFYIHHILVDSSSNIYLTGEIYSDTSDIYYLQVVKLSADGTISGRYTSDIPNSLGREAVRINDKLLILGNRYAEEGYVLEDMMLLKLKTDGTPDSAFSEDGISIFAKDAFPGKEIHAAAQLLLDGAGKIYVSGLCRNAEEFPHPFVLRLNNDGSPDINFSGDGISTPDFSAFPNTDINNMQFDTEGKILLNGACSTDFWETISSFIAKIQTEGTNSIQEDADENTIQVFPNPVSNDLQISIPGNTEEKIVKLFDARGTLCYEQKTAIFTSCTLSMEEFPSGIYFVSVADKNGKAILASVVKQ